MNCRYGTYAVAFAPVRADIQVKPPRPTVRQWLKALAAGLLDADSAAHTGIPASSSYDPSTDCTARAVLLDGEEVIWSTAWTTDTRRVEADRDSLAALLVQVDDKEIRARAQAGALFPPRQ
jgi:hypothetical protein